MTTEKPQKESNDTITSQRPSKPEENLGSSVKKGRKRPSPFRIKVGYVVALRVLPEGNSVDRVGTNDEISPILPDDSLIPVWTSPIKDRDEGLALVGRRVRCFLPKHIVEGSKRRVLEGEVVAIHDFMKHSDVKPWKVDLLIDKAILSEFPFLVRTDEDADLAKLPTERARRHARLEETLRGVNKCAVRVRLAQPGSADAKKALKWVIQKTVPRKLLQDIPSSSSTNGSKGVGDSGKATTEDSTLNGDEKATNGGARETADIQSRKKKRKIDQNAVKYLGDKDDTDDQQIANWRWMTSHFHDMVLLSEEKRQKMTLSQLLSLGFMGEVVKVESSPKGSSSLATVTVRRMILPEHAVSCSLPHYGPSDIFEDIDNVPQVLFRVPVEELVVLSREVLRLKGDTVVPPRDEHDDHGLSVPQLTCRWAYSYQRDVFISRDNMTSLGQTASDLLPTCHRCQRVFENGDALTECRREKCPPGEYGAKSLFCTECRQCLECLCPELFAENGSQSKASYTSVCDCVSCRSRYSNALSSSMPINFDKITATDSLGDIFQSAMQAVSSGKIQDFGLPESITSWTNTPAPSSKPVTRSKGSASKLSTAKAVVYKKKVEPKKAGNDKEKSRNIPVPNGGLPTLVEDDKVFRPTCARLLPYCEVQSLSKNSYQLPLEVKQERPRNLRQHQLELSSAVDVEVRTDRRAERAKQRRLLKGIAAFSNFDLDTLSNRESQLRFDRSGIHAWGVFADKDISSGDMIVEYRGEIIENAMAEKREKLYEAAKIGSDYMFRIDARFVCDATKVGNVARFINASCDPNCYTKIINVDGQKRIVIYAKKDIAAGEELCYDYKFPLEYDPAKRIPCHCGASNCRGFMNWDKKYVGISTGAAGTG